MAWLLREGEVLASLEVAGDSRARLRGYAGHEDSQAALLLAPARMTHSLGAKCRLDVAHLDKELSVLSTRALPPFRLVGPRRRGAALLLVEAGAFDRWGLQVGDHLEVRS